MKTKEMTMNDYKAMYVEYRLKAGNRSRLGPGTPESFEEFVAWRKRSAWMMKSQVEKYFENNKDSS
jgi:hypothetical protein